MSLTPRLTSSIKTAREKAASLGLSEVNEELVFLSIISNPSDNRVVTGVLRDGIKGRMDDVIASFEEAVALGKTKKKIQSKDVKESASLTTILEKADKIAKDFGNKYTASEHFTVACLSEVASRIVVILEKFGANIQGLVGVIKSNVANETKQLERVGGKTADSNPEAGGSWLQAFSTNLSELAAKGQIDPVIGRDSEIERLVHIICRRRKNNPVLRGEPGVGKTAVVEGLALKIHNKEIPKQIVEKKIFALDVGRLVAGTVWRGQFEERVSKIIEEVKKNPDYIVFIDEIHMLIGAGGGEGGTDASNLLKPALARGEFCCIGATTHEEYRRYIQRDSALERRLQPVDVSEPSTEDTVAILRNASKNYEKFHGVSYTNECISTIVSLTNRFVSDRYQPDKSFDVLDEIGSFVKLQNPAPIKSLSEIRDAIVVGKDEMQQSVMRNEFERFYIIRSAVDKLEFQLKELEAGRERTSVATIDDAYKVVEKWTGIPVGDLNATEKSNLVNLEGQVNQAVIGQQEAIKTIVSSIKKYKTPLKNHNKPIGGYLFCGPTGVGKTMLVKTIAHKVFGSEKAMIQLDMSEYSDAISVNRLIGSSAGYVGYDDSGSLYKFVQKHPYSIVLFDEIEKAHTNVVQLLLQILENGKMTDNKGKAVDFRNCVVILTSNAGVSENKSMGFGSRDSMRERASDNMKDSIRKIFAPELINRLELVMFNKLSDADLQKVFNLEIQAVNERLKESGVKITFTEDVAKFVLSKADTENYGARNVRKQVEDLIENPLVDEFLVDKIPQGSTIKFLIEKNSLKHKIVKNK